MTGCGLESTAMTVCEMLSTVACLSLKMGGGGSIFRCPLIARIGGLPYQWIAFSCHGDHPLHDPTSEFMPSRATTLRSGDETR